MRFSKKFFFLYWGVFDLIIALSMNDIPRFVATAFPDVALDKFDETIFIMARWERMLLGVYLCTLAFTTDKAKKLFCQVLPTHDRTIFCSLTLLDSI